MYRKRHCQCSKGVEASVCRRTLSPDAMVPNLQKIHFENARVCFLSCVLLN